MSSAGWHPDPSGGPGRLRWWDGQVWTEHVHDAVTPASSSPAGSPMGAEVFVVGPPRTAAPGCRIFELTDDSGGRLGRLVETSRGTNDSAFGAALSRSRGWEHATTRELRDPRGYPELVLSWGPAMPGMIAVTLPDRREVGRLVDGEGGWAVLGHDARQWGTARSLGVSAGDGSRLSEVTHDHAGGWRAVVQAASAGPLCSLVVAATMAADML